MKDEKGSDSKILAVPSLDPRYNDVFEITDVPKHFLREAEHFFETYKELEGKFVKTFGWENSQAAKEAIMKSAQAFDSLND